MVSSGRSESRQAKGVAVFLKPQTPSRWMEYCKWESGPGTLGYPGWSLMEEDPSLEREDGKSKTHQTGDCSNIYTRAWEQGGRGSGPTCWDAWCGS